MGTISIIGLGYVGIPLALLSDRKGYTVFGVDIDQKKVDLLNKKISPMLDEEIEKYLNNSNVQFTTNFEVVKQSSIIIICVPTPVDEESMPDLRPVKGACRAIAPFIQKGQLIVLESTVNPGVSDEIVIPLLEEETGMKCGVDFHVAHCPERINPGDKRWNVENINRVIGASDDRGLEIGANFYESIITGTVRRMGSLKEAEAVKIIENSFRDINIAFVNELAKSFDKLGIDLVNVINGAATKPFAFMAHYPGCGVGGHCIPVDPYYLIEYAKSNGFTHEFLSLARSINNSMPLYTVEKMLAGLKEVGSDISSAKIAVLGLSYKKDIGDDRESPSYEIIHELKDLNANFKVFDPFVLAKSDAKSFDEAINEVDTIIVCTDHSEFKTKLTAEFLKEKGIKLVIDGKNCLDKKAFQEVGVVYKGIGR